MKPERMRFEALLKAVRRLKIVGGTNVGDIVVGHEAFTKMLEVAVELEDVEFQYP